MGRVMSVAHVSVVIVPPGRNSELSSSLSWLLGLHQGHQLQCLPARSRWCQVLSLEMTLCCCPHHINVLGNWGSCRPSSTVLHGAVGLAAESVMISSALCHTDSAGFPWAAGEQQCCCSNLAVEACSAPKKFSLAGSLRKPIATWKHPRKHLSRPSQRLGVIMQCMALSSWMLSGN